MLHIPCQEAGDLSREEMAGAAPGLDNTYGLGLRHRAAEGMERL